MRFSNSCSIALRSIWARGRAVVAVVTFGLLALGAPDASATSLDHTLYTNLFALNASITATAAEGAPGSTEAFKAKIRKQKEADALFNRVLTRIAIMVQHYKMRRHPYLAVVSRLDKQEPHISDQAGRPPVDVSLTGFGSALKVSHPMKGVQIRLFLAGTPSKDDAAIIAGRLEVEFTLAQFTPGGLLAKIPPTMTTTLDSDFGQRLDKLVEVTLGSAYEAARLRVPLEAVARGKMSLPGGVTPRQRIIARSWGAVLTNEPLPPDILQQIAKLPRRDASAMLQLVANMTPALNLESLTNRAENALGAAASEHGALLRRLKSLSKLFSAGM